MIERVLFLLLLCILECNCWAAYNFGYESSIDEEEPSKDRAPPVQPNELCTEMPSSITNSEQTLITIKTFQYENKKLDLYKTIVFSHPSNLIPHFILLKPMMLMVTSSHLPLQLAYKRNINAKDFLGLYLAHLQQITNTLVTNENGKSNLKLLESFDGTTTNTQMLYYLMFILKCERRYRIMLNVGLSFGACRKIMSNLVYNLITLKQTESTTGKKRLFGLFSLGSDGEKREKSFIIGRFILPQLEGILNDLNMINEFSTLLTMLQIENESFGLERLRFPKEAKKLHELFCRTNETNCPSRIGCECLQSYVTPGYSCRCLGCGSPTKQN